MEATPPEKSRSLHNFSLPPRLTWGNQRILRCSKSDSAGEIASGDIHYSCRPRPHHPHDCNRRSLNGSPEVTREKLMIDLNSEVDKIKNAILVEGCDGDPSAAAIEDPRPWNLRTQRAACQEPIANCGGDEARPRFSPPLGKLARGICDGVKREREKFSVSLSRREIEEDFMELNRRRLARKPKKRPKYVQKQVDTLLPGFWLSEITADMYKVDEIPEPLQEQ